VVARQCVGRRLRQRLDARQQQVAAEAEAEQRRVAAGLLGVGLGGHLLLTCIQALTQAPPDALASDHSIAYGGYAAIAATACAATGASRSTSWP